MNNAKLTNEFTKDDVEKLVLENPTAAVAYIQEMRKMHQSSVKLHQLINAMVDQWKTCVDSECEKEFNVRAWMSRIIETKGYKDNQS